MHDDEGKIIRSMRVPFFFILAMWLVKFYEIIFHHDLSGFGLMPLKTTGLIGIITSPLLHENFAHLFANTLPLFILASLVFYFYREIAWRTIILIWLMTGLWVWVFARGEYVHIGASGIVNGLASFLFCSGIIRRDNRLMAVTLLVTFLYGGIVWGIFPQLFPNQNISWESHLMGLLSGVVMSIYYRNEGPPRKQYSWELEEEQEEETEDNDPSHNDGGNPEIRYFYKKDD
jgi:membrane associated rhomboid family serine protease